MTRSQTKRVEEQKLNLESQSKTSMVHDNNDLNPNNDVSTNTFNSTYNGNTMNNSKELQRQSDSQNAECNDTSERNYSSINMQNNAMHGDDVIISIEHLSIISIEHLSNIGGNEVVTDNTIGIQVDDNQVNPDVSVVYDDIIAVDTCKLIAMQKNNKYFKCIFDDLNKHNNMANTKSNRSEYFIYEHGLLMRKFYGKRNDDSGNDVFIQIVLPKCLRGPVLKLSHSVVASGHFGMNKTRRRILFYFYWPGIMSDIQNYCRTCNICQRTGKAGKSTNASMVIPAIVERAFSKVNLDIVGPLRITSKGNRYIVTIVRHVTKWLEAYSLPDCKSITVAQAFGDFISRFGIVDEVLHDLGTDFNSELFTLMLKFYGIAQLKCSVLHPQYNSACERTHRIIKNMLSSYVIELKGEWDEALPYVLFAYREIPNQDLGFIPA